jgi:hypothetical protein
MSLPFFGQRPIRHGDNQPRSLFGCRIGPGHPQRAAGFGKQHHL